MFSVSKYALKSYSGPAEYQDVDYNLVVCRIYLSVIEKLIIANYGINILKKRYKIKKLIKLKALQDTDLFLKTQLNNYIDYRRDDHVGALWVKERYERLSEYVYTYI
jgi:hypothetical protein